MFNIFFQALVFDDDRRIKYQFLMIIPISIAGFVYEYRN